MGNVEFMCTMFLKLHPTDTYLLEETKPDKAATVAIILTN